jgi:ubiquinone/menaquinone biosynthesis C-methylase UbiE
LKFSAAAARRLEILYSTPDIRGQREEALCRLALASGEGVIDIGSGPGFLCDSMAETVGPKGRVLGLDVSENLIEVSRRRNTSAWLDYRIGDAMMLDVPDAAFDAAVSMQVLEYLPDPDRAMREMARVLKPGGRALVAATDWDGVVWHSAVPQRMKRILQAWEAHCADPRLPRTLAARLKAAGFSLGEIIGYPIINMRLGEDTYSEGLLLLITEFVRKQKSSVSEEVDAWASELRALSDEGRYFFSTMRYFFLVSKPTGQA